MRAAIDVLPGAAVTARPIAGHHVRVVAAHSPPHHRFDRHAAPNVNTERRPRSYRRPPQNGMGVCVNPASYFRWSLVLVDFEGRSALAAMCSLETGLWLTLVLT